MNTGGICFFAILLVLKVQKSQAKVRKTDAFMSSTDLKNLFRMEMNMVEVIRKQKVQLEESLREIHNYVSEVEELYKGENCWPPEDHREHCDEELMMQKVVGNPIYNYQMLKRLLVYWKNMEESIKKIDTKGELNRRINLKVNGLAHCQPVL